MRLLLVFKRQAALKSKREFVGISFHHEVSPDRRWLGLTHLDFLKRK